MCTSRSVGDLAATAPNTSARSRALAIREGALLRARLAVSGAIALPVRAGDRMGPATFLLGADGTWTRPWPAGSPGSMADAAGVTGVGSGTCSQVFSFLCPIFTPLPADS